MKYLIEGIIVLPINILMAWWHSRLIKTQRVIRHDLWALVYAACVAGAIYWQRDELRLLSQVLLFGIACLFGRLAVFSYALNKFRNLQANYVSQNPASIIDKIELRLFGQREWVVDIIAAIIFIILQFFI